eukprot:scaffold5037_cov114-Isochrysis_galbana.AAC.18
MSHPSLAGVSGPAADSGGALSFTAACSGWFTAHQTRVRTSSQTEVRHCLAFRLAAGSRRDQSETTQGGQGQVSRVRGLVFGLTHGLAIQPCPSMAHVFPHAPRPQLSTRTRHLPLPSIADLSRLHLHAP